MTFAADLLTRTAADYADFLIPALGTDVHLLDVGCGSGTITLGCAPLVHQVIGVDLDAAAFLDAQQYAQQHGMTTIEFRVGNVYALEFPAAQFDAALCHSVLEMLDRPLAALAEIKRTLKPGGVLGVACVEYGGLILAGPNDALLRRFYAIREQLWMLAAASDPYRGRSLRGLLHEAGFEGVIATSRYICAGTDEAVRAFGRGQAHECRDAWYAGQAQTHGLVTQRDLAAMEAAWLEWSESTQAFAAFAWCRAIGRKPAGKHLP